MRHPIFIRRRDEGFTLIELLVVILIIGILAAIALSVLVTVQKAMETYRTDHDTFTTVTKAELSGIEPTLSGARNLEEGTW